MFGGRPAMIEMAKHFGERRILRKVRLALGSGLPQFRRGDIDDRGLDLGHQIGKSGLVGDGRQRQRTGVGARDAAAKDGAAEQSSRQGIGARAAFEK